MLFYADHVAPNIKVRIKWVRCLPARVQYWAREPIQSLLATKTSYNSKYSDSH